MVGCDVQVSVPYFDDVYRIPSEGLLLHSERGGGRLSKISFYPRSPFFRSSGFPLRTVAMTMSPTPARFDGGGHGTRGAAAKIEKVAHTRTQKKSARPSRASLRPGGGAEFRQPEMGEDMERAIC